RWPGTPPAPRSTGSAARPPRRSPSPSPRSPGLAPGLGRAAGGELVQQRGELSLHVDALPRRAQLLPQTVVLPTEPGVLTLPRIGRGPACRLGQRMAHPLVPLLTPRRDQAGVQTLPAQQRALTGLVQPVVLLQNPGLIGRGVG